MPTAPLRVLWGIALVGAGVVLWRMTGVGPAGRFLAVALALAVLATLVPVTRSWMSGALAWLRDARPAPVAAVLFVVALIELTHAAVFHRPYLGPTSHDARSYTLGALMLAEGRLATKSPGAPDSFDAFHLVTRPVYGSVYPPGTALIHVPGVWLGVPGYVTALLLSAGAVAAVYLLARRILGGDLAVLAALLLLGSPQFRVASTHTMSQVPALLWVTLLWWSAMRYTDRPGIGRAVVVGLFTGLLGVTRPQDAAWAVPAALVLLAPSCKPPRRFLTHAGVAVLTSAPLLALLPAQNLAITGSPFTSAYAQYLRTQQPGTTFSLSAHLPATRPATTVPQKHDYNDLFAGFYRDQHARGLFSAVLPERAATLLRGTLPATGLALIVPLGLFALAIRPNRPQEAIPAASTNDIPRPARWAMLLALTGFAIVYATFTFFVENHPVVIAGVIATAVAAVPVAVAWVKPTWVTSSRVALAALVLAVTASSVPGLNPDAFDADMRTEDLALLDRVEAELPERPSLLLIRYARPAPLHQEPVYNLRSPRPADHIVLRAHDLGPELNTTLFASPEARGRIVYHFDRVTRTTTRLGPAEKLSIPTPR